MNTLISLIECIGMLLLYNTIFNKDPLKNIGKVIILPFVGVGIIEICSNINIESIIGMLLTIVIITVILSFIEKKEIILISSEIIICLIGMFIVEMLLAGCINLTNPKFMQEEYIVLFLTILVLIIVVILNKFIHKIKINFSAILAKFKITNFVIYNLLIFFACLKLIKDNDIYLDKIVIQLAILSIVLIFVNIQFYKYIFDMLEKNRELEVQSSYNELVNDLISNLRANEHEYKNHLNTLYALVQILEGEELREKVGSYIGNIQSNDSLGALLDIDNVIIKAILYNKIEEAARNNIVFSYSVRSNLSNIPIDDSELTIILNNLINNAIEDTLKCTSKKIELVIEKNENYIICVKNKLQDFNINNISQLFKKGYSTKSNGRGFGLYNVKKIVEKHKGTIQLSIEDNFLVINITF